MRSRARLEKRLQNEQDTVGAQRSERQEQARLGSSANIEVALPKSKRQEKSKEREVQKKAESHRVARPGKPLKRAR